MIQIEEMEESMPNTSKLTILILAAGYGRRMGPFSRMINKSLVPYNNKPLISHIIDKFPKDSKFIIACGHEGQQVKDYLENVHKEKNISYVDIPNFNEDDTGPATSIRQCASVLPDKFLWITCDTLFEFDYEDKLDHSWIAVSPVDSTISEDYCWIKRDGNKIVETHNKEKSNKAVDAFIGFMYLNDRRFLNKLIDKDAKDVYIGFDNIDLHAYTVKQWQDFGTYEKWQEITKGLP
ncbi:MAG TPA: NTP transferase domain-containing protein, partial [Nitrososphaeraceae archaeon]